MKVKRHDGVDVLLYAADEVPFLIMFMLLMYYSPHGVMQR